MNYIQSFLNKFKTQIDSDKITLEDVELKIIERLKEKTNLDRVLKGMRYKVSGLMDQINTLSKSLNDSNIQKTALEESIELLKLDQLKALENYETEKSKLLDMQDKINNLDNQMVKVEQFNKQIHLLEHEYEQIKLNISEKTEELNKLKTTKLSVIKNKVSFRSLPAKKQEKIKKTKRCTAKTKSKHRCKNLSYKGHEYCYIHSVMLAPKPKMKVVNFR